MKSAFAVLFAALLPVAALAAETPADVKTTPEPTFVIARWKAKLYGFAELDAMLDSSQSFSEIQGNGIILKPGSAAADNGRLQETIRNSRIGFALETPDWSGTKGLGLIEGDFFGFDPNPAYSTPAAGAPASQPSESGFFTNPTFRVRHAWAKIESPYVDVLAGQTWSVLGGGGAFQPATVALQGINGEIYQRTEQLRLGKTIAFGGGSKFEIEVAALRPYQRDVMIPDLSAMLRLEIGGWQGYKSTGGTGGGLSNIQIAISGVTKQFRALPNKPADDHDYVTTTGNAIAVDVILPIIPATKDNHQGALTFVGEASSGSGYNDSFTGLNAGIASPGAPPGAATTYATTIDTGAVGWVGSTLQTVDYQSLLVNLQFYLSNSMFLSGVYSEMLSDNSSVFPRGGNGTFFDSKYASLALMWDVTPATRVGLEGVWTRQHINDETTRVNRRGNFSMWFYF
jgi:hypothetical protein